VGSDVVALAAGDPPRPDLTAGDAGRPARQPEGSARPPARTVLLPLAVGVAVAVAYLPGADRTLDYDSAQTVGSYVRTPSLVDAVSSQRLFNNHPALSLLEHGVHTLTGSDADWVLRLAPIGFAAVTVALLVAVLRRHLGTSPAVCAGLVVATNPTVVELSRAVRGYSLLLLCGVASSAALARLIASQEGAAGPARAAGPVYVVAVAVGLATHLYMAPILLGQVAVVVARRASTHAWVKRWILGCGLGGVVYLVLLDDLLEASGAGGRRFKADFPGRLVEVVGGTAPAAVLLAVAFGVGAWSLRRRRDLRAATLLVGGAVAFTWLVVASVHLEARFHVWLVPAVAAVVAVGVRRVPALAVVVVLAAGINAASLVDGYTADPSALPELAEIVDRAEGAGLDACIAPYTVLAIDAYTDHLTIAGPDDLAACDVLVAAFPGLDADTIAAARDQMGASRAVDGASATGHVFARDRATLDRVTGASAAPR